MIIASDSGFVAMAPQPGPMQEALSDLMPMLAKGPFPPGPKVRGVAPPSDSSPAREVTAEEAAEWVDNGVVCLRQVVPPAWTEYLRACLDHARVCVLIDPHTGGSPCPLIDY